MSALTDLVAQRAALDQQIREMQTRERAEAVRRVHELMSEYDLTLADLGGGTVRKPKDKTGSAPIKFRNQATGETWSGRGLQPRWLKTAIAGGATLEQFRV